jgi:RNA polymerase sigma-70 factor (ECF subfamily)
MSVAQGLTEVAEHVERDDVFVRLADAELDRAYRLAGLLLGNQADAQDATHDALVRAWSGYRGLRDPASFQAWFDRILVNVCRDRLRRQRVIRFLPIAGEHEQHPMGDPFQQLLAGDELLSAMAGLDPDLRTVIVLRFWADLTVEEIGRRCGWRTGTVKSRLHRALGRMRQRLEATNSREAAS